MTTTSTRMAQIRRDGGSWYDTCRVTLGGRKITVAGVRYVSLPKKILRWSYYRGPRV